MRRSLGEGFIPHTGFTLLEMLVVIGIIGVIITIATTSYSTAMKKSRDSRRKSDLIAIQNSLEQYYSICSSNYPVLGSPLASPIAATNPPCTSAATILTVPLDPLGGSYQCVGTCTVAAYTICPPVLTNGKYLETEDCTTVNRSCCLSNRQ